MTTPLTLSEGAAVCARVAYTSLTLSEGAAVCARVEGLFELSKPFDSLRSLRVKVGGNR